MMRTLMVFGSLERAGAQLRALEKCRLIGQVHEVHFDFCVLGLGEEPLREEIEKEFGPVYLLPIRSPHFVLEFTKLLKKEKYDVVECMPVLLSGIIVWLAKRQEIPVRIVNILNSLGESRWIWSSRPYLYLMRRLIQRNATHVVGISLSTLNNVFPKPWQSGVDCRIIDNGVPLVQFENDNVGCTVRQEFGWSSDCRIVINVARFSEQKNHRIIVETARLVHEFANDVCFLLVGEGALRAKISGMIKSYGLEEICLLAGSRTDVPLLLQAADVFFFPSLWEGQPGALLEALAAGLPVVASDIPSHLEIKEYFPSNFFVESPENAHKHAQNILAALDLQSDRKILQDHFFQSPFTIDNVASRYAALYGLGMKDMD